MALKSSGFIQILLLLLGIWSTKAQCPPTYEDHILILMSLDGFRPDYLGRGLTPTLQQLIDTGVAPPFMRATYPTVTFPNHYSIVTGLFPESHGIIANSFGDKSLNDTFSSSTGGMQDPKWWGGEPIWNTVRKQGKISAAYFWPGSEAEIEGLGPNYYFPYDTTVPFDERIQQVLDWMLLPVGERPQWICVYFNEPDHTGHRAGPDSWEVNEQLVRMDGIVKLLVDGIESLNLTDCTNLLIVSDHGMAKAGQEKVVKLEEYVPDLKDYSYIYYGANGRIDVDDDMAEKQEDIQSSLSCKVHTLRQFDKQAIPKRLHFSNNVRIEDIILDLSPGYASNFESDFYLEGQHGYDNDFREMQALFIGNGPDLKSGVEVNVFQNVELYNLMCDLLSLDPASTNGTKGALYHLMESPPAYPSFPSGVPPTQDPYPTAEEIPSRIGAADCTGDLVTAEDFVSSLNFTAEELQNLEYLHLPFGRPYMIDAVEANITLLYHPDHITGYSKLLKMPLWTSYTLEQTPAGTQPTSWSSDVRLTAGETQTCSSYDGLLSQNLTMMPMFRPEHANSTSDPRIPYLVSNAIPMASQLQSRYSEMINELIPAWILTSRSPLNVVIGTVFDNNYDSLVDNFTEFGVPPQAPSELFIILTRCNDFVEDLHSCSPEMLSVQSFIYHQNLEIPNCLVRDFYAEEYSARVKDVELATGLIFYPDLSYEDAVQMALRMHIDIWTTVED